MVIDFITTPIWKALKAEISRATGEEQDIRETSVADANYDSSGKTIDFYNVFGDEIASIDATAFIKDGMVDNVYLSGNTLVIDFNTESGQQDIEIDLTDFINPDLYYTSAQTDTLILNAKNDVYASANTYTDGEISAATANMVESEDNSIVNIIRISQADYDALVSKDPYTLYVIPITPIGSH